MSRKLCTAGKVGSFSFLVLSTDEGAVASIHDEEDEIASARHVDMDVAETWTDRKLQTLMGNRYEVE